MNDRVDLDKFYKLYNKDADYRKWVPWYFSVYRGTVYISIIMLLFYNANHFFPGKKQNSLS